MKLSPVLLVGFLLYPFIFFAQHLKQKGFLGVVPQPLTETVAKYLGLDKTEGAIIKAVIPGSAAEKMGVKENDILLEINNHVIRTPQDVVDISGKSSAGDGIKFKINRNKEVLLLDGIILARPMGYPEDVEIDLGEFAFEKGFIRTILFKPRGASGKLPVIYLIQGYPCFSMAYMPADFPYRTAINDFVKKGFAVFVIEKPGMGDGIGTEPCTQVGFNKELDAYKKGYEKLLTLPLIDKEKISLFGHSLGGFIAPLLAEKYKPKTVVVYGCGVRPWHDYLTELVREQFPYLGNDHADSEDSLAKYREVLYKYFFEKKTPAELIRENPSNESILRTFLNFDGKDQLIQRHYSFWQELNEYNLVRSWKNTSSPVLSIFGEADIAALKSADMERIVNIVNHYHPGNGKYLFVPKTNHDMVKTGTMKENIAIQSSPSYPQYLKNNFNHELIDEIVQWVKSRGG